MQNLKNKLKKQGGFTLVEMLIVVAIIAILIAISIPMVNSSLDKAKQATDDANMRAAKAVATIMYLDDATSIAENDIYNIEKGTFEKSDAYTGKEGYNQAKQGDSKDITEKEGVIQITALPDATGTTKELKVEWKAYTKSGT